MIDWEAERERIIIEAKKRLDELFPVKLQEPTCWKHPNSEMCEVSKKGQNTYFQCFELNDDGKTCGRKEWGI